MSLINDFMSLIYPRSCGACEEILLEHEHLVCTRCMVTLPKSNYHRLPENPLLSMLAGRVPLKQAACLYVFEKSGKVQNLLHGIKYEGRKELAEALGKLLYEEIKNDEVFASVNTIVPIPLHPKKYKARGYNQSELFASGINAGLQKQLDTTSLTRKKETSTQTNKRKFERWENVEDVFDVFNTSALEDKHVLLVDDVITTGATIEAAWQALSKLQGIRVSLATLAFAEK